MKNKIKKVHQIKGVQQKISELILGTAFYNFDQQDIWFDIMDEYFASGGNTLDTAFHYGHGTSEKVIGSWLAKHAKRPDVVIVTKGAHITDEISAKEFEQIIKKQFSASLENLATDYIDIYMLHRDIPSVPVEAFIDTLNELLDTGKIKSFGASNWAYSRIDKANEYAATHSLQTFATVSNNLSLAVPLEPFYEGLLSAHGPGEQWHSKRKETPLISWSSGARGFFAGIITPQMRDSIETITDSFIVRMLEVYGSDENFQRLRRAEQLAKSKGQYSAVQIAIAWALARPFPAIPIVGPRTKQELLSCVEAASIKLTESELAWLNLERDEK